MVTDPHMLSESAIFVFLREDSSFQLDECTLSPQSETLLMFSHFLCAYKLPTL
uniref:Uncharacterized protein n=1 Tax=Physcomitrium patens TaxID=3218 RepID=A0A2K1JE51_PHYPA|nr:hypothetical protein PHYPA_020079 [Physcomitrium patens]